VGYLKGFTISGKQFFQKVVTTQYPEVKRPKPERFHGRHVLNRYEDGMEKCIGCELCAGACPARCIYVRGADNPPDAPVSPGERYGFVYEINFLRCIHCDLCVEACPTEAITESKLFEFSFANRNDAIYTKAELVVDDNGNPKHLPWEDWHEGDDQNTSGWLRATAPAGAAAAEGRPLWSGELGYGVRPAQLGQSDPLAGDVPADTDISVREVMTNEVRGAGVATGRPERVEIEGGDEGADEHGSPGAGGH
jgi:NADH-quinone oxidoreductase subunit I